MRKLHVVRNHFKEKTRTLNVVKHLDLLNLSPAIEIVKNQFMKNHRFNFLKCSGL